MLLENADGVGIELGINCSQFVNCTQPALDSFVVTANGVANSTELRILSWGYFEVVACGDELHCGSIVLGEIHNFVKESVVKVSKDEFTIYEIVQAEVVLYGDDGLEYFGETEVRLLAPGGVEVCDSVKMYRFNESLWFEGFGVVPGEFYFETEVAEYNPQGFENYSDVFGVGPANIVIEVNPIVRFMQPHDVSSVFTVKVYIVDNSSNILEQASYLQVNLSINCTEDQPCINPELESHLLTMNGIANSSEYSLTTWGIYEITAYGEYLNEDSIIIGGDFSKVYSASLFINSTDITAFQEFEIEVALFGAYGEEFEGDSEVTLMYPEGIIVDQGVKACRGNGTVSFTVYAIYSGEYEFQADVCSRSADFFTDNLTVLIEQANIVVVPDPYVSFIQEYEYLKPFAVEVYIVDNSWMILENADYLQVNLSINCTEYEYCIEPDLESQVFTVNGRARTSRYSLEAEGTFEILATGEDLNPDWFLIHNENYNLTDIELKLCYSNLTTYEELYIEVIINEDFYSAPLNVILVYPEGFIPRETEFIYNENRYNFFSGYAEVSGTYQFSVIVNVSDNFYASQDVEVFIEPANIYLEAHPMVRFT